MVKDTKQIKNLKKKINFAWRTYIVIKSFTLENLFQSQTVQMTTVFNHVMSIPWIDSLNYGETKKYLSFSLY